VLLNLTPFYAESGGQVGDRGIIEFSEGKAEVSSVLKRVGKSFLHQVKVLSGNLHTGTQVSAQVCAAKRSRTEAHHTATHLLQAALRHTLGDHVQQAGSYVDSERLRFDFTHFEAITLEKLQEIERFVNACIREAVPVEISFKSIEEARKEGAMALFGEKYEERVRVVQTGDKSKELCGGCHVRNTGVIGICKILSDSAIAAGVRRIEAVCGESCLDMLQERERQFQTVLQTLSARPDEVEKRLHGLIEENKRLQREVEKWKQTAATGSGKDLMSQVKEIKGLKVLIIQLADLDAKSLRTVLDQYKDKLGSGVVVLGGGGEGKVALAAGVTKDLIARISAGDIVSRLAPLVGGGGGGRADMAQAGGKDIEKLPEALKKAETIIAELIK
jgi:alanyl-tRNA synthetase